MHGGCSVNSRSECLKVVDRFRTLGQLIETFERHSDNDLLLARLKELRQLRNNCAHSAFFRAAVDSLNADPTKVATIVAKAVRAANLAREVGDELFVEWNRCTEAMIAVASGKAGRESTSSQQEDQR